MIEQGKIITLESNDEYYVINKINLRGKCYLYISRLNPTDKDDLSFVEYKDHGVYPIRDENIIRELYLIASKKS